MVLKEKKAFTLIELMVVIFIIGIMATSATMSFSSIFGKNIYEIAKNITSNISYLYDKASLNGSYIKIEFNFKDNSYKVSASRDRVLLFGDKAEISRGEVEKSDKEKKREELIEEEKKKTEEFNKTLESNLPISDDEDEDSEMGMGMMKSSILDFLPNTSMKRFKKARFETIATNDDMNFDVKLPENIRLHAVYTEYYEEYVTKKSAELFIFPNNYIQRAVIVLEDIDDEKFISILVEPFSGESKIIDGKYSLSDEEEEIEDDEY